MNKEQVNYLMEHVDTFAVSWNEGEWYGQVDMDDEDVSVQGDSPDEVIEALYREVEQRVTSDDEEGWGQ